MVADGRQRDLRATGVRLSSLQRAALQSCTDDLFVHYLGLCAALCCLRLVVHLVGEKGHEEREAAGVAGARLSAVERLGGITPTSFPLATSQAPSSSINVELTT